MADFNFEKGSFNGTDISIFLKFKYDYYKKDTTGTMVKEAKTETVQIGNIAAIAGSINAEGVMRFAMGSKDPVAFSSGKRVITGQMQLETFNRSFLVELLENLTLDSAYQITEGGQSTPSGSSQNDFTVSKRTLKYSDELPLFDIEIIAVKSDDPTKAARRTIEGVKIFSETTGLGLSTIDIRETYSFMAKRITPFKKITE